MGNTEQIEKLVTKLIELTGQRKVLWQETARRDTYLAPVGDFVVTVGRAALAPSGESGQLTIEVTDNQGKTVEAVVASLLGANASSHEQYQRLSRLHDLARKSALESDQTISDLLSSLEQIR